jgi:hypothetical protein
MVGKKIHKILMDRDGMTDDEAYNLIQDARNNLHMLRLERCLVGEEFMMEWFGLETDYIEELI